MDLGDAGHAESDARDYGFNERRRRERDAEGYEKRIKALEGERDRALKDVDFCVGLLDGKDSLLSGMAKQIEMLEGMLARYAESAR